MEIPDAMLDTQVRQMLDDFSRRMQSQGLTSGAVLPVYRYDSRETDGTDETRSPEDTSRTSLVLGSNRSKRELRDQQKKKIAEELKKMC